MITTERLAFADLLDILTPEQWRTQSLCEAWTVKGVVAHLVTPLTVTPAEMAMATLRERGAVPRVMTSLARPREALPISELAALMRERAGRRFAPPGLGSIAPLTDLLVHRLDVSIPLGLADERPQEPWAPALDFLMSAKARVGFRTAPTPRLRYVATDLDWAHGDGPVVEAPAAVLGLALLRRTPRLDDLGGPGADALRAWALVGSTA